MRAPALAALALLLAASAGGCLGGVLGGRADPRDYVSDDEYTKWLIEVDSVQGQAASGSVLETLRSRLAGVASKPGGIEVRIDDTLPARGGVWSDRDILDVARANRDHRTGGDTAVTQLLFLDGGSAHDTGQEKVLGVAYGYDTVAIFTKTIRDNCTALNGCLTGSDSILRAVLVHEFGHTMGLVDNGIPMVQDHEDDAHPGHSSNSASVMYWAVETTNIFNVFRSGPPTEFDAQDRADLCAAGGRC